MSDNTTNSTTVQPKLNHSNANEVLADYRVTDRSEIPEGIIDFAPVPGSVFIWVHYDGTETPQYRPDNPPVNPNTGNPEYKYLFPKGCKGVHNVMWPDDRPDPDEWWLVEGTKQHLVASRYAPDNVGVVGIGGIQNWSVDALEFLYGKNVVVVPDADFTANRDVYDGTSRLVGLLEGMSCTVRVGRVQGKSKDGLDDFLLGMEDEDRRRESLAVLVNKATRDMGRAPAKKTTPGANGDAADTKVVEVVAAECLEGRYIFVPGLRWFHWTGKLWRSVNDVVVRETIRQYVNQQYDTATETGDRGAVGDWKSYMYKTKLDALVELSKGMLLVEAEKMDSDPDILNVQNGMVHLPTGDLRPHDPEAYCTKITRGRYNPEADQSTVRRVLEALPEGMHDYAQMCVGQGATGYLNDDDKMYILVGGGANAKSTVLNALKETLGSYAALIPDKALLGNPNDHTAELMTFRGVRFAIIEELPEEGRLNTTRMKKIVGTPQITARGMRENNVTFKATHTLFLSTNHKPIVHETDHGTWRRLEPWDFPYTFVKNPADVDGESFKLGDPMLRSKAIEDTDGFLAWIVDGARKWYANGKTSGNTPVRVDESKRRWRGETDLVMAYLEEQTVFETEGRVAVKDVYSDFCEFLRERGQGKWSEKTFVSRFESHSEYTLNHLDKRRELNPALSRPDIPGLPAPGKQVRVYVGLKFVDEGNQF